MLRCLRSLLPLLALACWLIAPEALAAWITPSLATAPVWAGPQNAGNPDPQRVPSFPVGTLSGTFAVTDTGAASFSIPLELPAAARGLEPSLALDYSSQLGAGDLGVGWSLGGQSSIHRCPHTLALDGDTRGVRLDDQDALCLDGARLMLIEGDPFEPGAVYRPRRDRWGCQEEGKKARA